MNPPPSSSFSNLSHCVTPVVDFTEGWCWGGEQCKFNAIEASAWFGACAHCKGDGAAIQCDKCKHPDLVYCCKEHMVSSVSKLAPLVANLVATSPEP